MPSHLEDEALYIETSGEMPQVALEESLLQLGGISDAEKDFLRRAVARAYLGLLRRDLAPENQGTAGFRGLERALANWQRLRRFLGGIGQELPAREIAPLAAEFLRQLAWEEAALAGGRPFATVTPEVLAELARALGLPETAWQGLAARAPGLPVADFLALRAWRRLAGLAQGCKARHQRSALLILELRGGEGEILAAASLPWLNAVGQVDPENRARGELLWRALPHPPCSDGEEV
ncbi:MAG: hypothetical protein KQJ78_01770 [Deltaproteobacteria bacterium]|nr:hypothetical protein [Deltaproteobacteria bacterium]